MTCASIRFVLRMKHVTALSVVTKGFGKLVVIFAEVNEVLTNFPPASLSAYSPILYFGSVSKIVLQSILVTCKTSFCIGISNCQ